MSSDDETKKAELAVAYVYVKNTYDESVKYIDPFSMVTLRDTTSGITLNMAALYSALTRVTNKVSMRTSFAPENIPLSSLQVGSNLLRIKLVREMHENIVTLKSRLEDLSTKLDAFLEMSHAESAGSYGEIEEDGTITLPGGTNVSCSELFEIGSSGGV